MKVISPQFELPAMADAFNLAGEIVRQLAEMQPGECRVISPDTKTPDMFPPHRTAEEVGFNWGGAE